MYMPQHLSRESGASLVEQIVRSVESRIDDKLLRTGARMPSIRQFADTSAVSRFTVVEAYDRLVAKGYLESRRGSGFYVRERVPLLTAIDPNHPPSSAPPQFDVAWLVLTALTAMALLPVIVLLAWRRPRFAGIGELAGTTALAILGNAAAFGILATAHNRYGARMVWLAALAVIVALVRWGEDYLGRRSELP